MKTIVVLFPGASLMEITPLGDGLHVRCPGCDREQVYRGARTGSEFGHGDRCPIHARIEQAIQQSGPKVNRG